ncbi:Lipid A core O-antigen ligase related enzyme [Prochlorococcus sp. MIT 0602]|nr:Lipid A core O-antigen ligase related enzyme [Prochlorococcus sp. MIT 0602]
MKDKWNWGWIFISVLMIMGSFGAYSGWLAWVGLANWIPFFWCFWGFQPYLITSHSRKRSAFLLLLGTLPVIFTGIGQIWFGLKGPWEIWNGLIIWFIAPGGQPSGRLSGLFNYANIAGSWLALVWPLALAFLLQRSSNYSKRSLSFLLVLLIAIALILTDSRNAWGAMFLSIPFILGTGTWLWLIPLLCVCVLPVFLSVVPFASLELQMWSRKIVPRGLWSRLADVQFSADRPLETTRLFQWGEAITLLIQRPWFGYGAAAFSVLYPLRQGIWHGHTHNLPLELAVAHGVPVAISLVSIVLVLLIVSFRKCFLIHNNNLFDRAWWSASFTLVFLHASDMPMFDSRINLLGWLFLAGLRCLIISNDSKRFLDV